MTELLSRVLVPIANEADAADTYDALVDYIDTRTTILVIHVIENAGGEIDKAGVEQRTEIAETAFKALRGLANADDVSIETGIHYGTDVAATIHAAADERDATAIAFRSRGGGPLLEFLSGSVRTKLVTEGDLPVIALPRDGIE
ncbi:universal stress protein [Halopenitus sp. H-Gu1]|uniref:universal stress protein n=1 Tax=Halopenitus sp. H-Gu1 TaxID=3242697 RepID=UPI00359E59B9